MWLRLSLYLAIVSAALFFSGADVSASDSAVLKLRIKNANHTFGNIVIGISSVRSNFQENMEPDISMLQEIRPDGYYEITLPPGKYAVMAYHDANGNGKLDKDSNGRPLERIGFSNDAKEKAGSFMPHFHDALIDVKKGGENIHTIRMR